MEALKEALPELLLLTFTAITFLQSGWDKTFDWNGNLSWLKSHFEKTPLRKSVPLLLGTILVAELLTGILSVWSLVEWIVLGVSAMAYYAAVLSCLTLLMLLFGQRIAKDYDGARTIVIYFIPAIFLLFLLTP
jgi:uncharacterized membrane protein YphA (DoxX/SURF4 family)